MGAIGNSGLVISLMMLVWALTSATGTPATSGTPEASPASGVVNCPVTAPVLADPPELTQPAGMIRDPLGLSWWYVSGDKVLWLKPIGSTLTVTGHRLGGDAPPLDAGIPAGYGGDYQASAVTFPVAGCWEVTARADSSELRFVTYVVEKGQAPQSGQP